ncbi:BrxA/BrxB family bacilliredoxin [Kitasatospora sp. NPDC006697]|uniref:BrxA/BrxB family bacilliredoxin n=1 Tax=Kitasatospora sp. NPDC006697 TaxID=3364020 RepID=UPI0036A3FFFD
MCGGHGPARPGVRLALENTDRRPDQLLTVFAEQDPEATARMLSYFVDIPPSDPSFVLFKDGELVFFMPRHRIETRDARAVASDLQDVFDEFCQ